jgi:hypothetical protein
MGRKVKLPPTAKLSTLKALSKENDMIIVDLGYKSVVLPREEAFKLAEILEKAETYEAKYWNSEKRKEMGMTDEHTYHVYPVEHPINIRLITDGHYQMAKLAGKPKD